jgi:uncharacterized protein
MIREGRPMTADDLNAPLGQQKKPSRPALRIPVPQTMAAVLALFLGLFALWAVIGDDPFGGEPMAIAPADLHPPAKKTADAASPQDAVHAGSGRSDGPAIAPAPPPRTRTITIIEGKTGERHEVVIPDTADDTAPPDGAAVDQKFAEMTSHGPVPKIAADGVRPAEAFAQPVSPLPGRPDAPRIAIIVTGLGVSTKATSDAITRLPGPVTLAFMPYARDPAVMVGRARGGGHEVLLQVPMEPFEYPDNDPGPQALLTALAPQQNIDRLYWLMSRFQGYVGLVNMMGGRFTASEQAFAPVLRETASRGLIFVDDGSNPRSVAGRIAGANNLPFVKADVVLDTVPTPAEIDRALNRLEMAARERGVAVGITSALPVSLTQIAKWAKAVASRGILLVPITAVALKAKQS